MWTARDVTAFGKGLSRHDMKIAAAERGLLNAIREDLGVAGDVHIDPVPPPDSAQDTSA
jgi:hypothetical protein